MKRLLILFIVSLFLFACKQDPYATDKPAYIYILNLSDKTPILQLNSEILGSSPIKFGDSKIEIGPQYCNLTGRLWLSFSWTIDPDDELNYTISNSFEFHNGHVYNLTIEKDYTCKLTSNNNY